MKAYFFTFTYLSAKTGSRNGVRAGVTCAKSLEEAQKAVEQTYSSDNIVDLEVSEVTVKGVSKYIPLNTIVLDNQYGKVSGG